MAWDSNCLRPLNLWTRSPVARTVYHAPLSDIGVPPMMAVGRRAQVQTVGSRLSDGPNLEVVAYARHERILSLAFPAGGVGP